MKRRPYIGLILILLPWLLLAIDLFGATITSNGTGGGDWRKTTTWAGGVVPGAGDLAVIAATDSVWFDADTDTCFDLGNDGTTGDLDISGVLACINSGEKDTLLMTGTISVNNGGSFIIDKSSDGTDYFIIIMNCSSDGEHGIIVDNGGIIDWDGASKLYATYSTSNTAASQADIVVNGDITDWNANDEIVVEGDVAGETEKLTIQSIASQTVTCTGNFTAQHDSARKVVNITRNVKFTSANASYRTYIKNSTAIQANFDMQYIECSHLRYGTFSKEGVNITSGAKGTIQYCSFHTGNHGVVLYNYVTAGRNISYNIFYDCLRGIDCNQTLSMEITNNYFLDLSTCIYLSQTFELIFDDNFACDASGRFVYINAPTIVKSAKNNISRTNTIDVQYDANDFGRITFEDSYLQSATLVSGISAAASGSYVRMSNLNGNNEDNRSIETLGNVVSTGTGLADTFVRTASSLALKMTPNDADNALEWEFTVPCVSGEPMALTGYLYCTDRPANASSDIEPSVSISGCGMTEDTYNFTIETDQSEDTWIQWTVSGTPTRNGLATVTISCYDFSATNPDYYIDDIVVASTAIELGRLDYWYRGLPAPILLSTGIGAMDIWKSLISIDYGEGSMGEGVKNVIRRTPK